MLRENALLNVAGIYCRKNCKKVLNVAKVAKVAGSNISFGPLDDRLGLDFCFFYTNGPRGTSSQIFVQNGPIGQEKIKKQNCPKLPRDLG